MMDVFITLLELGQEGYKQLLEERKANYIYLRDQLLAVAETFGERLLETPANPISLGGKDRVDGAVAVSTQNV